MESPRLLESSLKPSAVWTSNATSLLLKLYETNLSMLKTPKKKRMIWLAISDNLKDYNIEMTPDQVRWKINALTKTYKKCIETECHNTFKYFKEMDNIYSLYNVDSDAYFISELMSDARIKNTAKKYNGKNNVSVNNIRRPESKYTIKLRKIRLANRLEADRCQKKISLEKQWIDYLKRQECLKLQREDIVDKCLYIKEQELQLRKRELEVKQSLEMKKIEMKEKDLDEYLKVEREKCELLKQIFASTF